MIIGFDIISDLNLSGQEDFDWTGKPTSLFCIVPGNISSDIVVLYKLFKHLSKCYQGVFFIDGSLENPDPHYTDRRIKELTKLCSAIPNIVYLHTNVVVVDGIGLIGINGWEEQATVNTNLDIFQTKTNKYDDIMYLEKTLERLQLHADVKRIVVISNCVPTKELYFGDRHDKDELYPINVIHADTEGKLAKWVYSSSDKMVDTVINGVSFVNNPRYDRNPYYPKRIEIEV